MLEQLITAFTCKGCGSQVRLIILTDNQHVVIDADPSPHGRIIPWPSDRPTGIAMGRVVERLMRDEEGWSLHVCQ